MTDLRAWQHAYAVQAKADFEAYHVLRAAPNLPQCLALHSLQMACEKLSKAYLCSQKVEPRFLQASHAYTAKSLPEMFVAQRSRLGQRPPRRSSLILKQVKNLAREIELLAPTVDSQRRPDNCEYPWVAARARSWCPPNIPSPTCRCCRSQRARTSSRSSRSPLTN